MLYEYYNKRNIISEFGFYSLGIVANDKKSGSNVIKIFPIEKLSEYEGVVTHEGPNKKNATVTTGIGKGTGEIDKQMHIEAEWIQLGSNNRSTAPDVKKGETVTIYKFGEANKWFWNTMRQETDLRRKESVLYVYGNTDSHGEQLSKENSYYVIVDTKHKHIRIHTANNDGEAAGFDILLNTKAGTLTIKDTHGNHLVHNANGTLHGKYTNSVTFDTPNTYLKGNLIVSKIITDVVGNLTHHSQPGAGAR